MLWKNPLSSDGKKNWCEKRNSCHFIGSNIIKVTSVSWIPFSMSTFSIHHTKVGSFMKHFLKVRMFLKQMLIIQSLNSSWKSFVCLFVCFFFFFLNKILKLGKNKLGIIWVLSFKQLIQQYIQKYGASVTWKKTKNQTL